MKYCVIFNPAANQGDASNLLPHVHRLMADHALDYDLLQTTRPGEAIEMAEKVAQQYDVVVAAGGDGTVNEVLNGLMHAKLHDVNLLPVLGVLCVGRGNDFAFGMGITDELEAGVAALAGNSRKWIDVAHVQGGNYPDGRYVGNGVGIGFDAVVGFEAAKMKRLSGFAAYAAGALKTAFVYNNPPKVRLQFNEYDMIVPALMVSIMNGRRMGGGFMMAPESVHDDGLFDVCLAGAVPLLKIFPLIAKFMQGTQKGHEAIQFHRTNHIKVTAVDGALPAHADGETLCNEGQELELEMLPRQIQIVTAKE